MLSNSFYFFWRCMFLAAFFKRERLVVHDLFYKFSYRYSSSASKSYRTPFYFYKASLLLLFRRKSDVVVQQSESITFDSSNTLVTEDRNYLRGVGIEHMEFVLRQNLENRLGKRAKVLNFFLLTFTALVLIPISLLTRDKARVSLIMLELTECLLITEFIREAKSKTVYVFSAYEKDISFLSWLLKRELGLKVNLVPSSNPIVYFYKHVICDTFIFTSPFQKYEFESLKKNWFVDNTALWPPLGFYNIVLNNGKANGSRTIGFLSHGSALRESLGHMDATSEAETKAEMALIESLRDLQRGNSGHKILVYLHPLEKRTPSNLAFASEFYRSHFGNAFEFAPLEKPSRENFHLSAVAVAGFSSAQIERLYGGYRILFAPMGHLRNYFSDDRLEAITVHTRSEFLSRIDEVLELTDEEFFTKYNLKDYRWDSFNHKNGNSHS